MLGYFSQRWILRTRWQKRSMILGVDCVNLIRIYEEHKPVTNTVPRHKHNDIIYAEAGRTTECN